MIYTNIKTQRVNILFHIICAFILYKTDWNLLIFKLDNIFVAKNYLKLYGKEKIIIISKGDNNKNKEIIIKKRKRFSKMRKSKKNNENFKIKNKVIISSKSKINKINNYIWEYNFKGDFINAKKNENAIEKEDSYSNFKVSGLIKTQEIIEKSQKIMEFNDEELNNFSYSIALKCDKRTYSQYYISLLRTKHILFFSFCNNNDYNSKIIKIDLFFIGFILDYTVNALFFDDKTMHKIYEDKGKFNIIYQLPQIIYSYLISSVLDTLLQLLALSDDDIIDFKQNNDNEKETTLKRKLCIKFICFFILGFICLLCFGYYLSMFCAIYINTQIHLIKDTLLSFGISLVSPIIIYIFPGLFRIPALSDQNKKSKYLFLFSKFLQML